MKILYIVTKAAWGGAQRYVYDVATAFSGEAEVVVAYGEDGPLGKRLAERGIRTVHLPALQRDISFIKDVRAFFVLLRLLRRERPDIVHLNSSKAGGLGALAARIARVPRIVFTAHGWPFKEPRSSAVRMFRWFFSWLSGLFAHKVIAVSYDDWRAARTLPFVSRKCTVVHNGVGEQEFVPRARARRELAEYITDEKPSGSIWIGTISELTFTKGILHLIWALQSVLEKKESISCVIVGDGEERGELERLVAHLNISQNVFFTGHVPDAVRYLKAFDMFVLSSVKEGLPYAILEAGQAGVPVVASRVGGIPEIIDHKNSGLLVPPASSDALQDALLLLLGDKKRRTDYAQALNERVNEHFTIQHMIAGIRRVYGL